MPEQKYEMKERQRASRYQIIREESSAIEIAVLYWEMDNDRQNGHAVVKSNRRAVDENTSLQEKPPWNGTTTRKSSAVTNRKSSASVGCLSSNTIKLNGKTNAASKLLSNVSMLHS